MELFNKKFIYLEWDDALQGKEVFVADTLPELRRNVRNDDGRFKGFVNKNSGDYTCLHNGVYYAFIYYDPNYECKVAYLQGKKIEYRRSANGYWHDAGCPSWDDDTQYRVKPEKPEEPEEREEPKGPNDFMVMVNEAETFPKVNVVPAVSSMPLDWHVKTRGSLVGCTRYVVENYCRLCEYKSQDCGQHPGGCRGFKKKEIMCNTCQYQCEPDMPCRTCKDGSNYKMRVVVKPKRKRRMTYRELAKWVAQGNGEYRSTKSDYIHIELMYYEENEQKPCGSYIQIRGWDETEWHEPEVEG